MPRDTGSPVLCLFPPDRYDQVLAVMADSALLPRSHDAWRHGFEERLEALARRGVTPVVVTLDPEAFESWCAHEDLPCDACARLEYAESLAACQTLARIDAESTPRLPATRAVVATDAAPLLTEVAA